MNISKNEGCLILSEDDYKQLNPLLFDSEGEYVKEIARIVTSWGGPYSIYFENDEDITRFYNIFKQILMENYNDN